MVSVISGHIRLTPSISSPSPLFPSLWAPLLSLCHFFVHSSLILSFYPSVPISREASPINLFKQPSEHPIHSSVDVWERASSLSQEPSVRPPSPAFLSLHPHLTSYSPILLIIDFLLSFLYHRLLLTMTLIVTDISVIQCWLKRFLHCFAGHSDIWCIRYIIL